MLGDFQMYSIFQVIKPWIRVSNRFYLPKLSVWETATLKPKHYFSRKKQNGTSRWPLHIQHETFFGSEKSMMAVPKISEKYDFVVSCNHWVSLCVHSAQSIQWRSVENYHRFGHINDKTTKSILQLIKLEICCCSNISTRSFPSSFDLCMRICVFPFFCCCSLS